MTQLVYLQYAFKRVLILRVLKTFLLKITIVE